MRSLHPLLSTVTSLVWKSKPLPRKTAACRIRYSQIYCRSKHHTLFPIGATAATTGTTTIRWFRLVFPGSHAVLLPFLDKHQYKSNYTTKRTLRFLHIE